MDLKISTHVGLRPETRKAIASRMPAELEAIVRQCFGLDLPDPSELQVLPPVECATVRPGKFIYWKLRDVLDDGNRQFAVAQEMITAALVRIFRDTEVVKGERFTVRGCIPHVGTFTNVTEDFKPKVFKGTKILKA
ncbi:MAG: hypothetical protein AAB779_01340 [Patescibacteria group bacterium]